MAYDLIKQEIGTKRAGEDMLAARGKAVVFNSSDRWQIAGLTGPLAGVAHGILTNNPASGRVASVQVFGIAMAKLGGTVTGGRYVDIDANGNLIENHPNGQVGVAMDSGIAGSIIPVFLVNRINASALDHSDLGGLANDDHPQYRDGSLAYTGDLDMGTNDISNVGLVDTVDVSALSLAFIAHQLTIDDHGDVDVTSSPPSIGQVLGWDGFNFVPVSQATFGEYVGPFDASVGTFPVTGFQGDWFNTSVAGTVGGQPFIVGDILIALIDSPSTTVFAGNWTIVPSIGISDHTLLTNIGVNTHAQIDTHIADADIHLINDSVQVRRTTSFTLLTAFGDVTFDSTDIETDAAVIEHNNAATDDIDIKFTGFVRITVGADIDPSAGGSDNIRAFARVRLNDAGVDIPGSLASDGAFEDGSIAGDDSFGRVSCSFITPVTDGDKLTLQMNKVEIGGTGTYTAEEITLTVERLT